MGCLGIPDLFWGGNGDVACDELLLGPADVSRILKKEKDWGGRCLQGELGRRGLADIFSSLVSAGFPVIGAHQGYPLWVINVDGVHTSFSSPSSSSSLFSSPFLFLLSPPSLLQAVGPCCQGPPGVFSGACSPGHQCLTVLSCRWVSGCIRGHCTMPCCWHWYEVAWIQDGGGWLMVVVVRKK